MLTDAPDPLEVANFRFRQMRKLCMNQEDEKIPTESINLIATSSKYGLVFIGIEEGFKVLKLENIFDLNEDEEKRKEVKDFPSQKVTSPTPCLLALSNEDVTLAVCVTRDSCAVADMYDIRAFADQEEMPVPFTSVRLSSDNNVKLRDFMWNPMVVEMYAFCLSDGSMYVHELADTNLKIAANLPPQTNATAVCWSPKGKEVVVGKRNGSFSRFKPTLQEVKNFPPPAGLDENGVEVVSIFWISTTLFAVVYVSAGNSDDRAPSLVFASTPKGADITYSNFGDVCYGSISDRDPRYMMHYDPEWKILICVSSNAIESAIIGCSADDKPVWQQCILDDSGRAEIPLVRDAEPSPLGMGVIYCAQRKIVVSDTESYPPMPVLFLLSTSGLLCPFHMLNTAPGAANLVYPSEPICREGERRRKENAAFQSVVESQKSPSHLTSAGNLLIKNYQSLGNSFTTNSNNNVISSVPSVPANSTSVMSTQAAVMQNTPTALQNMQAFMSSQTNSFSFVPNQNNQKVLPSPKIGSSVTFGSSKQPPAATPSQTFAALKPFSVSSSSLASPHSAQSSGAQVNPSVISPVEQSSKKFAAASAGSQPSVQAVNAQNNQLPLNLISADHKSSMEGMKTSESTWIAESTIVNAVLEEVAEFNRELQELKERSSKCEVLIGTKDEMSFLKKSSLSLVEFHHKMNLAIETLVYEVHSLKTMVLESYAMLSEAESQEKRLKDPKYVSMLRERSLDPRSAKQIQKIQQLNQYLSTQLSEVNDKLDNDWHEFVQQQKKNKPKVHQLPSAEAIYRNIVSNQNIIYNQKSQLDRMAETLSRRKREGQLRGIKLFHNTKLEISDDELGKLADALLQTKINNNDGKVEIAHTPRKTIPPQKQSALREVLVNRRITSVKPTMIYSPSQSRLCSTLPMSSLSIKEAEKSSIVGVHKKNEKLENVEPVSLQESVPENVPYSPQQEVPAVVPPFTAKPPTLESKGGITQGIPITKTLSKPTPSLVPSQALNSGTKPIAFKTVQNGRTESSSLMTKNSSQSAFTHLVPAANKPVPESPKIPPQNNAGKSSFTSQNFLQQKNAPGSGFVSMSNPRPGPEQSFVPVFTFSEPKDVIANNAFSSNPLCSSSSGPEPESLAELTTADQLGIQVVPLRDTSESSGVQSVPDLKSAPFFFSPVNEGKSAIAPPVLQKDVPKSHDSEIPSLSAVSKSSEISASVSPGMISVSSSDYLRTGSTTSVGQHSQSSILIQSVSGTPSTAVSSALASGSLIPKTQVTVTSPSDTVIQPSLPANQKEAVNITTQAESPFSYVKHSVPTTASALPPLSQPNSGKVAAFTFSLPVKDQSNQKEVKNTDTAASSSLVPTNVVAPTTTSATPGDASVVDLSATSSTENSASSQKTIFGSLPSSLGTPSSTVFGQPMSAAAPTAPATTAPTQSLFGQTVSVSTTSSGATFGLTTTTPSSSSFEQKIVTTAATSSTVTTTTTTATTTSTLPFFGQQSTSQSSFFGKTALTSPVFGQAPQTQNSVFGQTVSAASSSPFGQTGTGSFFNQSPAAGGTSVFGQKAQSPSGSSAFGQTAGASGFSFQKASMEQQNPGSFGLTKPVFGQNAVFGQQQQQQSSSAPFGQSSSSSSGGVFGQGGFFSGLGGKPSEENASKNVFASTVSSPPATTGIFGNQGASSFGAKLGGTFSGGSFSSGSGTVAQSGFGAFQQTPQKTSGFGAPPSFGGSPTFGGNSPPNFGGSPTFGGVIGSGNPLGGSTFCTTQADGFGSFASSNSPTFGSLASQTGAFGSAAQQQAPTFGSMSPQPQPNAFGGGSVFGGSPGFGAAQSSAQFPASQSSAQFPAAQPSAQFPAAQTQSSFGSPTNATQSSAFSQWRN